MSEQTAREKLSDLGNSHESNASTVKTIETVGHAASLALTGVAVAQGAYTAVSAAVTASTAAGGTAAAGATAGATCFMAPIAAGVGGALAGAWVANKIQADEMLLNAFNTPRQAQPGPEPAHITHKIAHNKSFLGAVGGLLAGIAIGALATAAIVATGGLAATVLIAGAAGFAGGFIGTAIAGAGAKAAHITGAISTGSPNVFFEGKAVARVTDLAACDKHPTPPQIAEGSETVSVNSLPLARIGHKTTCGAVVQEGCKTIFADSTTGVYGPIDADRTILEQSILSFAEVALSFSAIKFRSSKTGREIFGEPIDPSTGDYVSSWIDMEYPGAPTLPLTRTYPGKERVQGLLGTKWICNWSQRIVFDKDKPTAILEDADGQHLLFNLGNGPKFNARHLKAPYYQLTGDRQRACLFDTRNQQTIVFCPDDSDPLVGRLTSVQDRNGNRIDFVYEKGALTRVAHSDGIVFIVENTPQGYIESIRTAHDHKLLAQYAYDDSGAIADLHSLFAGEFHFTYTKEGWLNHWSDSGATSVDLRYDSKGRVIATSTPDGIYNDRFVYEPDEKKVRYIDAEGATTTMWFNEDDLLIKKKDPLGNITEHAYDGLERKLSTTDALGRVTAYDYDLYGNLVEETDWASRTVQYKYDPAGLPLQMRHPDGTSTFWEYDDCGNLIQSETPDGVAVRYEYDENGRLTSEIGPDGAVTQWEYDREGRLCAVVDALGQRTRIARDAWLRPQSITDPEGRETRFYYERSPDNPWENISRIVRPDGGILRLKAP